MTPPIPATPPADVLLPCPFCGNVDGVLMHYGHSGTLLTFAVLCEGGCYVRTQDYITMGEAASAWNIRTPLTQSPPPEARDRKVVALRNQLADLREAYDHDAMNYAREIVALREQLAEAGFQAEGLANENDRLRSRVAALAYGGK